MRSPKILSSVLDRPLDSAIELRIEVNCFGEPVNESLLCNYLKNFVSASGLEPYHKTPNEICTFLVSTVFPLKLLLHSHIFQGKQLTLRPCKEDLCIFDCIIYIKCDGTLGASMIELLKIFGIFGKIIDYSLSDENQKFIQSKKGLTEILDSKYFLIMFLRPEEAKTATKNPVCLVGKQLIALPLIQSNHKEKFDNLYYLEKDIERLSLESYELGLDKKEIEKIEKIEIKKALLEFHQHIKLEKCNLNHYPDNLVANFETNKNRLIRMKNFVLLSNDCIEKFE